MTTAELTATADRLSDLILEVSEAGVTISDDIHSSLWAIVGIAYATVRRPDTAPKPIAEMIASMERSLISLTATLAIHEHRTREAGQ